MRALYMGVNTIDRIIMPVKVANPSSDKSGVNTVTIGANNALSWIISDGKLHGSGGENIRTPEK